MYLLDTDIVIYSLKGHFERIEGLRLTNWSQESP
jgi:predicted nucleic acid-binding protein